MKKRDGGESSRASSGPAAGEGCAAAVFARVYRALRRCGHDPEEQLVGYLLSGDPTYITECGGARCAVTRAERGELLQELLSFYLAHSGDE